MNRSLSLRDATDADAAAAFDDVARQAAAVDGYRPFNEQALLDVASGQRQPLLITADGDGTDGAFVGAAIVGGGELDLVVAPEDRRQGVAAWALPGLLERAGDGDITAWAHGDHPGAAALAARFGFASVRTLLQLRVSPVPAPAATELPDGISIDAFRPGVDDAEWLALNARVFAHHPEQGGITAGDLAARQAEPWFDAGDMLIARESGRMVGYNWLKIEPDDERLGEIYVIGVHPEAAGQGLGRALMNVGLARLRGRGCKAASLYVEADNGTAVRLYRSLGFTDFTVDVQYRRAASA